MDLRRWRTAASSIAALAVLVVGCGRSTEAPQGNESRTTVAAPVDSISIGVVGTTVPQGTDESSTPATEASRLDCGIEGFDVIAVDDLPPEAIETRQLIADGGPYPFRQDDGVFQNRERILPKRDRGYYREYTVVDPTDDDRGPRRIVVGECGEQFYTDDHYDSFQLIDE